MRYLFLGGLMVAMILGSVVLATKANAEPSKVEICHVNDANESYVRSVEFPTLPTLTLVFTPGKIISVSEKALASHSEHGDAEYPYFLPLSEAGRDELASEGIHIPNADCLNYEIVI